MSFKQFLAIGDAGAANAGLMAAQILATSDQELAKRIITMREEQTEKVLQNAELEPIK